MKTKQTFPGVRAGDRVAVWGEVVPTPSKGLAASFSGVEVPLAHLTIVDHWKRIQVGDKVRLPGHVHDEHTTVTAMVGEDGAVLPPGVAGPLAMLARSNKGGAPGLVAVDNLTRHDA